MISLLYFFKKIVSVKIFSEDLFVFIYFRKLNLTYEVRGESCKFLITERKWKIYGLIFYGEKVIQILCYFFQEICHSQNSDWGFIYFQFFRKKIINEFYLWSVTRNLLLQRKCEIYGFLFYRKKVIAVLFFKNTSIDEELNLFG